MQEPQTPEGVADDAAPRFDVRARLTGRVPAEVVLKSLVTQVRMPADKAEALVQALRASPSATIGRGVSRERADKARALAVDGLEIDVSPVLSLAPKSAVVADEQVECPACGHRGVLSPERQCTACGVYVDKVSPEAAMRRRLLEQERAKLAWQEAHQAQQAEHESLAAMEARLREEIRAELERRHGRRRGPIWRELWRLPQFIGGFSATVLAAFTAGWWMPTWLQDYHGSYPWLATYALTVFFVLRAAGRFLGVWLLDRLRWDTVLAVLAFAILLCFAGSLAGGTDTALWLLPLSGLFMSMIYPTLNSKGISCFGSNEHGAIAGVILCFTAFAAAVGPLAMAAVSDAFGNIRYGFALATGFALLMFAGLAWNRVMTPAAARLARNDKV